MPTDAEKAVAELEGKALKGRALRIRFAQARQDKEAATTTGPADVAALAVAKRQSTSSVLIVRNLSFKVRAPVLSSTWPCLTF